MLCDGKETASNIISRRTVRLLLADRSGLGRLEGIWSLLHHSHHHHQAVDLRPGDHQAWKSNEIGYLHQSFCLTRASEAEACSTEKSLMQSISSARGTLLKGGDRSRPVSGPWRAQEGAFEKPLDIPVNRNSRARESLVVEIEMLEIFKARSWRWDESLKCWVWQYGSGIAQHGQGQSTSRTPFFTTVTVMLSFERQQANVFLTQICSASCSTQPEIGRAHV